jgi:hypothetical protein
VGYGLYICVFGLWVVYMCIWVMGCIYVYLGYGLYICVFGLSIFPLFTVLIFGLGIVRAVFLLC